MSARPPAAPRGRNAAGTPFTVALVGMGPRGLSVLERLLVRLAARRADRPVRILACDDREHGAGRIWRTDQSPLLVMNTVAEHVTMYSGSPDGGPPRPGAGPSLAEWLRSHPDPATARTELGDYAPRAAYGRYLRDVHRVCTARPPDGVEVRTVRSRVDRIVPDGGGYRLHLADGRRPLTAHKVVLATGHPVNRPGRLEAPLREFAAARPGLCFLTGDADLDAVGPGGTVAVLGMGLTFYDVMTSLTQGRGGRFERDAAGRLHYLPGGAEPRIVAGSRGGLPVLARGRNQKPPHHVHRSLFLTADALTAARAAAVARRGDGRLDFAREVRPLLDLEVHFAYYAALLRSRRGAAVAERFTARHREFAARGRARDELLARFGMAGTPPPDLDACARPFRGRTFATPSAFTRGLRGLLAGDLREAERGNVDGPLKAAFDVLRDIRGGVRLAVDHGGLRPASHRADFLGRFVPVNALLSAGPPAFRVEQLVALLDAGVVEVAGPDARFGTDHRQGRFTVGSPQVPGSTRRADALVDARTPVTDVRRDRSPLTAHLLRSGLVREYVTVDPVDGECFATGGLAVTEAPFHVVGPRGRPNPDVYALGLPTEHTRWFTQVGSGRPGLATGFHRDADAIAADVLTRVRIPEDASLLPGVLSGATPAIG